MWRVFAVLLSGGIGFDLYFFGGKHFQARKRVAFHALAERQAAHPSGMPA